MTVGRKTFFRKGLFDAYKMRIVGQYEEFMEPEKSNLHWDHVLL